jgi:hypothetical protein
LAEELTGNDMHNEVESRLDALFDERVTDKAVSKADSVEGGLAELKSLVMSIEWEITDDLMDRFIENVDALKQTFKGDRILFMFLQLLGSLGLYVKTNKGKAHPNAFGLLASVYSGFEDASQSEKMTLPQKKKLLYVELNKYKELKELIAQAKSKGKASPEATRGVRMGHANVRQEALARPAEPQARPDTTAQRKDKGDLGLPVTHGELRQVVEEIRRHFDTEINRLRTEIRSLTKA